MSSKMRPHYADAKNIIVEGFDGSGILCEGITVPTNGTSGFAPGALFLKRAGAIGASLHRNDGSLASCLFVAVAGGAAAVGVAAGYKIARGVATITGTGTVVTGLATVVSVTASMQTTPSLTNGTQATASVGDQAGTPAAGSVILSVWKPTASGDATPIASAAAVAVNWIAVGT